VRLLRWIALAVLAMCATCLACALPPPENGYTRFVDVPPATCHSTFRQLFAAPDFTDPAEQAALTQAVDDWRAFSGGQIDMAVVFSGPGRATIHRLKGDDPIVTAQEAKHKEASPDAGPFYLDGWESDGDVYLVAERVVLAQLHTLAAHELGHAAGMRWPLCFNNVDQACVHSPDPTAVMAATFSGAPAFNPSDLALCRASCLCP
jgi:hypothetical protein